MSRVNVDRKDLGVNELPTVASPMERTPSYRGGAGSTSSAEKPTQEDVEHGLHHPEGELEQHQAQRAQGIDNSKSSNPLYEKLGPLIHSRFAVYFRDLVLVLFLIAWFVVTLINDDPKVAHRRIPIGIISMCAVLLILFHNSRYLPQRPIVRVISTVWGTGVNKPWSMLPSRGKLAVGWLALLALIFGTTYGLPENEASNRGNRTISLVGFGLIYGGLFAFSKNHKAVKARTTILGIGFQFIIALLVFRTDAFFSLFRWLAIAAADLLVQAQAPEGNYSIGGGAEFFWSTTFVNENHFFFVNVLSSIIFFVALCIALFYTGALQYCIKKAAWVFFYSFGISGGEAVVAVASPFIGQGENCVLVRPFVPTFTKSEFHQVLTSGFATIAGSVFSAYVLLGVNGKDLITSSVMSIPASIAASKIVYPETEDSDTAGRVVINREESEEDRAESFFEALSNGASFGLKIALLIFCNVLVLVSLVTTINGILAYIGNSLYITDSNGPLTLQLIFGYVLWPLTFMLGVPRGDVLQVSKLIAIKIIANEFVGYNTLQNTVMKGPNPLSPRGYLITTYALCGFANIASMSINIGVLSAMAPKRKSDIVRLTPSALVTGALVTLSSAAVAGIVADPGLLQ
ncbi:hypothetical protein BDZ90DRAFT_232369 [Jaminaea rosea]|uniref:H+/nucleoside cotransporter n=1 Tax=Jaminaea rosea TaxID=1569628 RepID=A0A316USS8_9BASI|nr:hypothetical protein BDZ90DRAFT_232369 [Jaminaea rosea]PWN27391.1 hypothetical protein BDZ90DRAFT_232369 [Jaminaea rosea]